MGRYRGALQANSELRTDVLQHRRGYTYYFSDLVFSFSPLDKIDDLLNPFRRKTYLSYASEFECLLRGFTHKSPPDILHRERLPIADASDSRLFVALLHLWGVLLAAKLVPFSEVTTEPAPDLLLRAKHLFVATKVAGIRRTEIDRRGGPCVGPCPTARYPCPGGTPVHVIQISPKYVAPKIPELIGHRKAASAIACINRPCRSAQNLKTWRCAFPSVSFLSSA
jgi:hypothetical protein